MSRMNRKTWTALCALAVAMALAVGVNLRPAVAAGLVQGALGSDTGGSIRQPASFCGVVGLKPPYGRVSRWGLVAFASSLDQIGVFARSAADAAWLLEAIAGHDPKDSTSLPEPVPRYADALDGDVSGLVLGLPREYFVEEGVDPGVLSAVRSAVAELERGGAEVREVSLPHTHAAIATYYLIATAEASSNLARYDGVRYGRRAEGGVGLTDMYQRTRSEGFCSAPTCSPPATTTPTTARLSRSARSCAAISSRRSRAAT